MLVGAQLQMDVNCCATEAHPFAKNVSEHFAWGFGNIAAATAIPSGNSWKQSINAIATGNT